MRALVTALLAARLAVMLISQVFASGVTTAWTIVSPARRPRSGIARMPYEGLSEAGAAVLASMIAVTPGTTPVDIDHEGGEMWIHFLDVEGAKASIASIRARYEVDLRRLFPVAGGARE